MTALLAEKRGRNKIPEYLIYEIAKGKPIYYKGYKHVLNKTKKIKDITMESLLQSWLKAQLSAFLIYHLRDKNFEVTAGELGINLSKEDKRGADIAIFRAENFQFSEHFSNLPPEIVIEIDVKADTENETEFDYVLEKISDYHKFGVQKVIWVFTKTKKIMEASADQSWIMNDWTKNVEVLNGLDLNIGKMIAKKNI